MREKQSVMLNIHVQTFEHGQPVDEQVETVPGMLYRKGKVYYLKYIEHSEEGPINTTLKLEEDRLTVIRHGAASMNHVYRPGTTTRGIYHTPYGPLHMETHTTAYRFKPLATISEQQGELHWAYYLSLNGNGVSDIHFTLTLTARAP
ncbi:uncharacterized beta-barrel protein YwiB (DUF1934 family) [Caldalkalibacillus uzonensis]|uniref:Uncharacterized beta-barrel protein YwiB (DUF1934 family) n=1 Tax=Caldalkalibacillus uzonensis TaxID=353224 RepID=A0ABU0CTC6_9BACI|nr:DUF1934 domain-containing protein [Caldalkalibacillus uzonensis]MDQ0339357.1 uncharacterized beta-barrel protein YwiB (DUF1934 family) [Caldalkalibacillus uzonensis]